MTDNGVPPSPWDQIERGRLHQLVMDVAKLEDGQKDIRTTLARIEKFITGGDDPERGLVLQVDRLKQDQKRLTWWQRVTITAAIGAVFTVIGEFFMRSR